MVDNISWGGKKGEGEENRRAEAEAKDKAG